MIDIMNVQAGTDSAEVLPAVISLEKTALSAQLSPVTVYTVLSEKHEQAFLLESSEQESRLSRFSFIGANPCKTVMIDKGLLKVSDRHSSEAFAVANPLQALKQIQDSFLSGLSLGQLPTHLPFVGGLVGYLGYGVTNYLEGIAPQSVDPFDVPQMFFGLYDSFVAFDHLKGTMEVISYRGQAQAKAILAEILAYVSKSPEKGSEPELDEDVFSELSYAMPKEEFLSKVISCKEFIRQGEVFQIVLAQRFFTPYNNDPLDIYKELQSLNPSPYAYFLKFPGFCYLGSSPETFVQAEGDEVCLRALAGTRPRGKDATQDDQLAQELLSNEKELAEHHMLVDLGRNDLGRICEAGSVKVGQIATLLKFAHVMHLSTEIRGTLQHGKTSFDLVQSCFPRGTVSGAPKIRAMQLLSKLEAEQRGIYSGAVGYFGFDGNYDGAIAIRSALVKNGVAHVNAGAGIVWDSTPEAEYNETLNKAKSVIAAIKIANENL